MSKNKREKNSKNRKKKVKIFLCSLGCILAAVTVVTLVLNTLCNRKSLQIAHSFSKVTYEEQLIPQKDKKGNYTFTADRDLKVVQLTDIHLGGGYMSAKKDAMALNAVAAMVTAEKPDLVIVTGDIGYPVPFMAGTFNNKTPAKLFAEFMETLGVYWTLGFGNHDTEAYSYFSREDLSDFYGNGTYSHCLFQRGPENVSGYGNQIINVQNGQGILTQSLYVLDSHSYTNGDWFGIFWKYDNIHQDQVDWYKENVLAYNAQNAAKYTSLGLTGDSAVKSALFFHIPLAEYKEAWMEYYQNGCKDTENVKYYFGTAGENACIGIGEDSLFETAQALGSTKAIFCGHDHVNDFSLEYKGIRLTYGMSIDYLAYPGICKEGNQRGCTVITLSPDGSLRCEAENYYQEKYVSEYEKETVTMEPRSEVAMTTKAK